MCENIIINININIINERILICVSNIIININIINDINNENIINININNINSNNV